MRRKGLILAPITALAALGVASPSLAADVPIKIEPQTFAFAPKTESVGVGDTVTWTFNDGNHTTTSLPGQPDKWNSGLEDQGGTFQKTFTTPGRYQYICIPHRDFMKGTIVVGSDTVKSTAGKQSIVVKKLKQGSYKAALTLSDDFDNTSTKKTSFKVR